MNPFNEKLIKNMCSRCDKAEIKDYTMTSQGILRYMEIMSSEIVDVTVHDDRFNGGKQLHVVSQLSNGASVMEFVKFPDNGVVSDKSLLGRILGGNRGLTFDSPEEVAEFIMGIESEVYVYIRSARGTPIIRIDRATPIKK